MRVTLTIAKEKALSAPLAIFHAVASYQIAEELLRQQGLLFLQHLAELQEQQDKSEPAP